MFNYVAAAAAALASMQRLFEEARAQDERVAEQIRENEIQVRENIAVFERHNGTLIDFGPDDVREVQIDPRFLIVDCRVCTNDEQSKGDG